MHDDSNIAVKWFNNDQTTANPDKFQSIIFSRHRIDEFDISLDGHVITRGNTLKILGVALDDKLNFNEHVHMCQTASCQINALKRISNFLNEQCRMHVYKSFVSANFNYCPIVWLFCSKTYLKKLEKLQEQALATVYCDKSLAYEDMLKKSQLCIRLNHLAFVTMISKLRYHDLTKADTVVTKISQVISAPVYSTVVSVCFLVWHLDYTLVHPLPVRVIKPSITITAWV